MTDIAKHQASDKIREFVLLWGEMASSWGVNKTFAQIHALLYATGQSLDTDSIMEILEISRGSANMNLRALADWGLVSSNTREGSRKDFYEADGNIWDITIKIINERSKREIKPLLKSLGQFSGEEGLDPLFKSRLDDMINVVNIFESFTEALIPTLQGGVQSHIEKAIEAVDGLKEE